jgi:hypothetical protein
MARLGQRDLAKERFWRRMMRLWRRRGPSASVRDFCGEHGLSEASFYAWRRILAERDRRTSGSAPPERPLFVPLTVLPSAPVAVTPALELVLGSGRVVRVPPGFDAAALRQLLAVLGETPSC